MLVRIKYLVYGLTLTYPFFFFSIYSILGMQFEGSQNNLSYIYGYALFSLLSTAFGLHSLLKSGYIHRKSFIFLIIPLIITLFYLFENPNTKHTARIYLTFICIVFPVILIGLDMAKYKSLDRLRNILFLVFIIITIDHDSLQLS